jgi:hypothetical protein
MPHSGVPKARGRRRANRMMDAELAASIRQSKSTNSGTEKVKASKRKRIYASRIISDHIMVPEDFERLHKFLLETFTARACRKDPIGGSSPRKQPSSGKCRLKRREPWPRCPRFLPDTPFRPQCRGQIASESPWSQTANFACPGSPERSAFGLPPPFSSHLSSSIAKEDLPSLQWPIPPFEQFAV